MRDASDAATVQSSRMLPRKTTAELACSLAKFDLVSPISVASGSHLRGDVQRSRGEQNSRAAYMSEIHRRLQYLCSLRHLPRWQATVLFASAVATFPAAALGVLFGESNKMGGAASIQELGEDLEGIDDGEMSNKMQTVLENLKKKGMSLTEENFQNEAKIGLNEKDFERAVAMADKVKSRFESKQQDKALSPKSKRKRKKKGKHGKVEAVKVSDEYDVITGLRATVTKVQHFREAVKKFIGSLDMDTVLTADERIHERMDVLKGAEVTKKAEKGGVIIELLGEAGCKKQTNSDGSELYQWGDGTLIKHSDDIYVMKLPSGNVVQYNEKDQVKIFQNPDGIILQVQGSSDVVNIHDGSENEYMSKPSAKICAIEPIDEREGYRLQYNGSGKKKSRFTMYTECSEEESPTLILFDDGLYVVTYPGGDKLQRHPDGSFLHIDPRGKKQGRTADGDNGANKIPTLSSRLPNNISDKWIGSIQEDMSPEQSVVEDAIEVFVDSEIPGGIPADIDVAVEEFLKLFDELATVQYSKGETRYYNSLFNRVWRQRNGIVKASNLVAVIKQSKLPLERIALMLSAYLTTLYETVTSEDRPDRNTFAREWSAQLKSRDFFVVLRCTLCALVGNTRPTDEVKGLPLLLLDTKDISISFLKRHENAEEATKDVLQGKVVKMRSLAGMLTLQEQDAYIPMFGILDVDGDGMLEPASVLKVLECSGLSSATQVKILSLCLQGDPWREMNAIEFTRAMQLAAVAQEGEDVSQPVYNTITDIVDELDCLTQIELCRMLDPIAPPSDLLPVVSKIIAKILKFYAKERVPGFNNKLKILSYLETIPMRPPEIQLSIAIYRRMVRLNGGRPTLHELVHQLQHTKMSSLDIINAVAVSVIFTAQDLRIGTLRSAHVEVATQEVMERAFRLLACAQQGKGRTLKSLTLKETKTFKEIPMVILRARKVGGVITDVVPGLTIEEREFLSPRYEGIDMYGDDDCPSVLVANDLQLIKGLKDSDCRKIFDSVCAAYQDDGHSISYQQYCVIMKLGSLVQQGQSVGIAVAKAIDAGEQVDAPTPALSRKQRPVGDWFAYMSDSSGSEDDDSDESESSDDDDDDAMLSGSESSELPLSESEDEDEEDAKSRPRGSPTAPQIEVLTDKESAKIFGTKGKRSTESKTSPRSKRGKKHDGDNIEETIQVGGVLHLEGMHASLVDKSSATGVKVRSAIKNAIVQAAGVDAARGNEKFKVKINVAQDGLRSKVRYKLVLAGSHDAMQRSKERLRDILRADEPTDAGSSQDDSSALGDLIKQQAERRGVKDLATATIKNVKNSQSTHAVRVSGTIALNAGISARDLEADNGDCIIEPLREAFAKAANELPDVNILGDGFRATVIPGPQADSVRISYEFSASSANVGPKTSQKKAALRNTKAAQAACDKFNELIAEATDADADKNEGSLAEQLATVVKGLSDKSTNDSGLQLASLNQSIHSDVASDAVDTVTFLLKGAMRVRAPGLVTSEVLPPAPGGLGLAKMISQPPPNVDTQGLRITSAITGAKKSSKGGSGCVKVSYAIRVGGPATKAKICIDAIEKKLLQQQAPSKAAAGADPAAAAQADKLLAEESSALSRYAAELSDDPLLRQFDVVGFLGLENVEEEASASSAVTVDYDSEMPSGGVLPGGTEPSSGSAKARKGHDSSPRGSSSSNVAVVKGSFSISGCPPGLAAGSTPEFVAAVEAGLEHVLAGNSAVREAVESGVVTHRIKVTGIAPGASDGSSGQDATEVSYVLELQHNDEPVEPSSPSKKARGIWDFVPLDTNDTQRGATSHDSPQDLPSIVNAARTSIAKALPPSANESGNKNTENSFTVSAESQAFVDHMSAQFAAVQPQLASASALLADRPVKVRSTTTAISDAKSYRKFVAAGTSHGAGSSDVSSAVEFGSAPSGSLAQRKRRAKENAKRQQYRLASLTTEAVVEGFSGDANTETRHSTCRAVELAVQDVLAKTAKAMAQKDPEFDSANIRYLSRVVAFRRAGANKGGARAADGKGPVRLTVQTLVDHPSSRVARTFSKAAKKAVDAALEESASIGSGSELTEDVRRIATALAGPKQAAESGALPTDETFAIAAGEASTHVGTVELSQQPGEKDWANVSSRSVQLLSADEARSKLNDAASPSSRIEGKVAKSKSPDSGPGHKCYRWWWCATRIMRLTSLCSVCRSRLVTRQRRC